MDDSIYPPEPTTLTVHELWYLLGMKGPFNVIGIENPYLGCLINEINSFEQHALQALLDKGILEVSFDQNLKWTNSNQERLLKTIINPDHCIWLTITHGEQWNKISQHFLYFHDDVILDVTKGNGRIYILTPLNNLIDFNNHLQRLLSHLPPCISTGSEFILPTSVFNTSVDLFSDGDIQKGTMVLSTTGLKEIIQSELESALGNDGNHVIAVDIRNPVSPTQCYMNGIGYIYGPKGGWVMQEYENTGEEFIRFSPGTIQDFQKMLFVQISG